MIKQLNIPSPVQELAVVGQGIRLFIKREDLIHPTFGGNKWRKLKYNIEHFKNMGYKTLITFGGPFSNHIAATAQACQYFGIDCVGIIRGDLVDANNPTLSGARDAGMKLHHINKEEYRLKDLSEGVQDILRLYEKPFLIPEGGSNIHARKGVMELVDELDDPGQFDFIFLPAGTGMTASGVISAVRDRCNVIVVNVLKNKSLNNVIANNLVGQTSKWKVLHDYTFGGYAKVPQSLVDFNQLFWKHYGIMLDPVYNAKAMYAVFDCISQGQIPDYSNVLYLHTGGLQGVGAYEYVQRKKWVE